MKKIAITTIAALGAIALPAAAQAQDTAKPEVTIGASVGLHDLAVDVDDADLDGFDIDEGVGREEGGEQQKCGRRSLARAGNRYMPADGVTTATPEQ